MTRLARSAQRHGLFLALVAAMFAAIFVARLLFGSPDDAISVLFTIPIALVAVRMGIVPALGAAVLAGALVVVWVAVEDVSLSAIGYAARAIAFLVAAGAVGFLEQRQRDFQARAHALTMHDDIVQGLTIARYSIDHGQHERAVAKLDETLAKARAVVTNELGDSPGPGDLRLDGN